jgi:hypothetical protein
MGGGNRAQSGSCDKHESLPEGFRVIDGSEWQPSIGEQCQKPAMQRGAPPRETMRRRARFSHQFAPICTGGLPTFKGHL